MNQSRVVTVLCLSLFSARSSVPDDLQQLRERITAQEQQIKQLQEAVAEQKQILEQAIKPTATGGSRGTRAHEASAPQEPWSPLSISIGNTTFTPLGFVDATFFGRSTNLGSGIGTNFASAPYNTSATGHLSEMNLSTQNSRIGFRVDSNIRGAKVLGYFEADFLGNQPSNILVTSNSDTFRMRNIFVDVKKSWLEVLAGQDWSLATPNRLGLSPLPSDIFYTQNMDTNYQAGLVWSRQTQVRFVAHPAGNFALGVSLENPQQYAGGSGGAGTITPPAAFSSVIGTQVNSGSTNYTAANLHPDIIFKGAYDGHAGDKLLHVEAGALIRSFKFAAGTGSKPVVYNTHSATAVSGEVNANLELAKNFRVIANTFFGFGNGRYVFGLAPDFVIRADGSISPIHTYSTVSGFEANIARNTLLYSYYGGLYVKRETALDANGMTVIGYGGPTTSASTAQNQNRAIQEATAGVVQTFWKNPNYGALSLITQYSYLTRDPWYLVPGSPKATHANMYWVDLRYTLP
jgi:hypothetical protein